VVHDPYEKKISSVAQTSRSNLALPKFKAGYKPKRINLTKMMKKFDNSKNCYRVQPELVARNEDLNDYYLRGDEKEQDVLGVPIHCFDEYMCLTDKESSRFTEGCSPKRLPKEIAMLSSEAKSKTQIGFMKKDPMGKLQRGETVANFSHIKRRGRGSDMHSPTNTQFNYQALGECEILKSGDGSQAGMPLDNTSGKNNYPLCGHEHEASDLRKEFDE
jgi:hypothetical protein